MHNFTFSTPFTFGDTVRIDSPTQGISGFGRIYAITVTADGGIDYMVESEEDGEMVIYPGILESEMRRL